VIQSREAHAAIAGAEELLQSARTPEEKHEAERSLSLARSTQNSVVVRARSDGVVGTRGVKEGEVVAEDTELLTLVDLSTVDFVADVPLRDLPSVRRGQKARVQFPSLSGRTLAAQVDAIYPQTDGQSQTIKVRLRFLNLSSPHDLLLRTDIAGVAHILIGLHRNSFMVPKSALLRDDETDSYSIVTITPDSLSKSVHVTVGETTDSTAEVRGDAVHAGIPVITTGNYALPDSTRVSVERP
jgi:RND family efflux transporter MFP subunit